MSYAPSEIIGRRFFVGSVSKVWGVGNPHMAKLKVDLCPMLWRKKTLAL